MTAQLPSRFNSIYPYQTDMFVTPTAGLPGWVRNSRKLNATCEQLISKGWGLRVVKDEVRCTHPRDRACKDVTLKRAVQLQATFDEFEQHGGAP